MIIDIIAGARPNFMKIAPLLKTINQDRVIKKKYKIRLIHTGQHYDKNMSHDFFKDLEIQLPDHNLGCKSMSRTRQIDKIMIEYLSKSSLIHCEVLIFGIATGIHPKFKSHATNC